MLNKLLKYELKNIYKFLMIFYSFAVFFAILARIFLSIENSFILNIIGQVCSGTAIAFIINILINNLIRLWVRFKGNLYGDESYLTHTLPVKKGTIYLSKAIIGVVTLFTSVIVILLTLFIAYYSKESIQTLKALLVPMTKVFDVTIIKLILAFFLIFFLEIANALQCGFTGIILGHKMNSAKAGFSVLYGFLAYMLTQVFAVIIIFITALFNKDLMNLFFTNEILNVEVIKTTIYMSFAYYLISIIAWYFINLRLFKKGVNVD